MASLKVLFVARMGIGNTATIVVSTDGMTTIGQVKPGPVASPHGGDLSMTMRILPIR